MKRCSYCGAEYPDEMSHCPVDQESLEPIGGSAPESNKHAQTKYEIPPLSDTEADNDWTTILVPHSQFEATIVLNRRKRHM
jgi:hypothetical protein